MRAEGQTARGGVERESTVKGLPSKGQTEQYSLAKILGLAYSWPARRFRSNWMSVVVHGVEGLIVLPIVLMVILGLSV